MADVTSQLSSTTSDISLALSVAKLAGVDPSYTQSLTDINAEAVSLTSSNLTSAQLAVKTAALDKKLATAKATQAAARQKQAINDMTAANTTIAKRLAVVEKDKTAPVANVQQYVALNTSAQTALAALKSPPPTDLAGAAPTYPSPDDLLSSLDDLDTALEAAENKVFNWTRFGKKVTSVLMKYVAIIAVVLGALLGGIIMSNTYASDYFWGIKVFYFIYGAAFFPLSLIYGAIKTPYWVSGLIPLSEITPRQVPTEPPPLPTPVAKATPATTITSKLKSLLPIKLSGGGILSSLTTLAAPKASILSSITNPAAMPKAGSILSSLNPFKAKTPAPAEAPAPAPAEAPAPAPAEAPAPNPAAPPPPTGIMSTLFSFTLVDPVTPTAAETASRNTLRIMSIVDLIVLATATIYYGVDRLILKNKV